MKSWCQILRGGRDNEAKVNYYIIFLRGDIIMLRSDREDEHWPIPLGMSSLPQSSENIPITIKDVQKESRVAEVGEIK